MHVVWFKRDLRIRDNEALYEACKNELVLPLYICEPDLWKQPDLSHRHFSFLEDCISDLNRDLSSLGQKLVIKTGDAVKILDEIHSEFNISHIWSHQETWSYWTYERDKRVRNWTKQNNINWIEKVQNGVIRKLKNRDGWSKNWNKKMYSELYPAPKKINKIKISSDKLPDSSNLGLKNDNCTFRQKGGSNSARTLLESFLQKRGQNYSKEISSPLLAYDSGSRLSPHIAFGTISIRNIVKDTQLRKEELKNHPHAEKGLWSRSINTFTSRLRWHCHFIQKLEDEPEIEFKNMHSAYDKIRSNSIEPEKFEKWKKGITGFPMIDASMRSLIANGWLNFRMRAMLMSFASYHLWLPWQQTSLHLAKLFTDYEPGIHYPQCQMQSGTTGINSIRIYNPIKQSVDHDPNGIFVKKWVPELKEINIENIHSPWEIKNNKSIYPKPMLDEKFARKEAARRIFAIRKVPTHKDEAKKIYEKHGSRKSGLKKTSLKIKKKKKQVTQKSLF